MRELKTNNLQETVLARSRGYGLCPSSLRSMYANASATQAWKLSISYPPACNETMDAIRSNRLQVTTNPFLYLSSTAKPKPSHQRTSPSGRPSTTIGGQRFFPLWAGRGSGQRLTTSPSKRSFRLEKQNKLSGSNAHATTWVTINRSRATKVRRIPPDFRPLQPQLAHNSTRLPAPTPDTRPARI